MTIVRYTFVSVPLGDSEGDVAHMHISVPEMYSEEPGWSEKPRAQRKAAEEALKFVKSVVESNKEYIGDESRLFKGDMPVPENANLLMTFDIKVCVKDGVLKFKKGDYKRYDFSGRWTGVIGDLLTMMDRTLAILRGKVKIAQNLKDELEGS